MIDIITPFIDIVVKSVDWAASAFVIVGYWLIGNRNKWGHVLMLCSQPLFLAVIFITKAWGLLPMNIFMWIITIRNTIKWHLEETKWKENIAL